MARTKGAKNRVGAKVKDEIVACFELIGGRESFRVWAKEHQSDFYRMFAQLAPKEITADVHVTTECDLTDEQLAAIATGSSESDSEETQRTQDSAGIH
jgi:hypothetical protein